MAVVQVVVFKNDYEVVDFVYHILGTDDGWDSPHDNWRELNDDEYYENLQQGQYDYEARESGYLDDNNDWFE